MENEKELMKKALLEIRRLKRQLQGSRRCEPAAVVGMACRFPGGVRTPADFWELLKDGRSGICGIPAGRWEVYGGAALEENPYLRRAGFLTDDPEAFDSRLFRILPDEAAYLDPQQRILLEVCWEAFENAGYAPDQLKNQKVGVFVGVVQNDFAHENLLRDEEGMNLTGMDHAFLSGRISYFFGLRGPALSIDTACSSSSAAIDTALKYLLDGDCDMALVCGVNIMFSPEITKKVAALGILSERGEVRAFDRDADGTVRGEGAAALLLRRRSDAERDGDRIHSLILGSALNQDGESTSLTAPNGIAQEELLRDAWAKSGITPDEIGYLETHGTGTAVGDPIEIRAIASQLSPSRKQPLYIGSVKTNLGHLEGAAGIAGVIKASLMLEHRQIPASLHFETPSDYVPWDDIPVRVADRLTDWETADGRPRIAGISSFGLSGTNSHIVMQEYPAVPHQAAEMPVYPFLLTAPDPAGLMRQAAALRSELLGHPDSSLTDLSYTYNITRAGLRERALICGKDRASLLLALEGALPSVQVKSQRKLVFVFTGQGSQYPKMCQAYYRTQERFRQSFDRCAALYREQTGGDLHEIVFGESCDLSQTVYAQPAIFAAEYALTEMLASLGVRPDAVLGHSIGEYAAACAAGILSLADAVRLVCARGRILQALAPEGRMLAVFANRETVLEALPALPEVWISASNAPEQTVIAGTEQAVSAAARYFGEKGIRTVLLRTVRPFHTPLMQQAAAEFQKAAETAEFHRPSVRMISSVTAQAEQAAFTAADYWSGQILSEVRFCESVRAAGSPEQTVFLEIGALPVLTGLIAAISGGAASCFPIADKKADTAHLIRTVLGLWTEGAAVQRKPLYSAYSASLCTAPNYRFDDRRLPCIHTLHGAVCAVQPSAAAPAETAESDAPKALTAGGIRQLLSRLLGLDAAEISDSTELVSLGLDSISAAGLLRNINRSLGVQLTLGDLFRARTPEGLAEAVRAAQGSGGAQTASAPAFRPDPEHRFDPFPLNEVQYAYWAGRSNPQMLLSGSACCAYFEADVPELDEARFLEALRQTEARHDMLRCRITEDAVQYIAAESEPNVTVCDFTGQAPSALEAVREEMSRKILPLNGPLYEIRLSRLDGGAYRIHFLIDFMIADAMSLFLFRRDFGRLYAGAVLPPLTATYRDYELYCRSAPAIQEKLREDEAFWAAKAEQFPPAPQLPYDQSVFADHSERRFVRRRAELPETEWKQLSANAAAYGLTLSAALFSLYAEVLSAFGGGSRFAVMLTVFRRHDIGAETGSIIGDFTKLAAVEVERRQVSVAENAQALRQTMLENISHCEFSAVKFTEMLRKRRGEAVLFPVIFTSAVGLEAEQPAEETGILDGLRSVVSSTPQVCMDHQVFFERGRLILSWDTLDAAFAGHTVDAMFEAYSGLVRRAASDPAFFGTVLTDLRPAAQRAVHNRVNDTAFPAPAELLHAGFCARAAEKPDNPAVIADGRQYSYAEVHARADDYAAAVLRYSQGRNARVLVDLPKSFEQVCAVIGILKAGCAYVPLTAGQPASRTARIAAKAEPVCIISGRSDAVPGLMRLDPQEIPAGSGSAVQVPVSPSDTAYIIFTSGSTGEPKGVVISHGAAVNTIRDVNRRNRISAQDRALAVSSLSFDLSVYDIFGMLSAGGAVVMPTEEQRMDPKMQHQLVTAHGVTLWNSVPALMGIYADYLAKRQMTCGSIRHIFLSGDWIPVTMPEQLKTVLPDARLVSMGGATEASIWSNVYDADGGVPAGWHSVPYGYPLANQRFYILDEFGRRCPDDVPGRLHIAGAGLADGYCGDPALTDAAFFRSELIGERLYDTGDYGCYRSGGCMEFLGRKDGQVKINGYRVETGELEAAVRRCGVTAKLAALPVGGRNKRLVVFAETAEQPDSARIIGQLRQELPAYFIPEAIVGIGQFPVTANGKIDRKRLAEQYEASVRQQNGATEAPETPEAGSPVLRTIGQILGLPSVRPSDSFGRLGVSSVDMIRLADELEQAYGVRPSVSKMLSYRSVAELAAFFDGMETEAPSEPAPRAQRSRVQRVRQTAEIKPEESPLEKYEARGITLYAENGALRFRAEKGAMTEEIRAALRQEKPQILEYLAAQAARKAEQEAYIRENAYPLTPIQKAYLLGRSEDYELGGTSAHYYTELVWPALDVQRLEQAVNTVIGHHDILQTVVLADGRQMPLAELPYYRVVTRKVGMPELEALRAQWQAKVYPVGKWPMFDVFVSELPDGRRVAHFSFDCMLLDGWSANRMIREIDAVYAGAETQAPAYSFREYVTEKDRWQQGRDYVLAAEKFWKKTAPLLPPAPQLPYRTAFSAVRTPHFARLRYALSREQTKRLSARLRQYALTASAVVCTAYMQTLSRTGGSETFSLNLTVYNRLPLNREVAKLLGDFTNVTAVPYRRSAENRFLDEVAAVRDAIMQAVEYRTYNGLDILKAMAGDDPFRAVLPVVFTSELFGSLDEAEDAAVFTQTEELFAVSQTPQVALDHQALVRSGELVLIWDYVSELFEPETIREMFRRYTEWIGKLAETEDWSLL